MLSSGCADTLTLAGPGVFIFVGDQYDGMAFTYSANKLVTTGGATVYLGCQSNWVSRRCNPGEDGPQVDVDNSGSFSIDATTPGYTGIYYGLALMFDPNSISPITMAGSSPLTLIGSLYAKSAPLKVTGGGGFGSLDSRIVVYSITGTGGATLHDSFDESKNIHPRGPPALFP
jgi:hypothetical protein